MKKLSALFLIFMINIASIAYCNTKSKASSRKHDVGVETNNNLNFAIQEQQVKETEADIAKLEAQLEALNSILEDNENNFVDDEKRDELIESRDSLIEAIKNTRLECDRLKREIEEAKQQIEKNRQESEKHEEERRKAEQANEEWTEDKNGTFFTQIESSSSASKLRGKSFKVLSDVDKGAAIAGSCVKGFMATIPPDWCWKKPDFGTIPTGCPSGYHRWGAECFKHCNPGYYWVAGGTCWSHCGGGWKDIGACCVGSWFRFKCKHHYWTHRITNFDSRVPCPSGKYKSGALCYRDCSKVFLENCGIGACASSAASCVAGIVTMVIDILVSVVQLVTFICSFGTSSAGAQVGFAGLKSAAKSALKQGMNKAKEGLKVMTRVATNTAMRKAFVEQAKKKAADHCVDSLGMQVSKWAVGKMCETVANDMITAVNNKHEPKLNLESFDPTGIAPMGVECAKDQNIENNRISCAKKTMEFISIVDPTGIVGLAAAFLQASCDV